MKQNNCQSRLLYLAQLFLKIKGDIKIFLDKHKLLNQFMSSEPVLQKILKGILHL
jgi:hypothetical protein